MNLDFYVNVVGFMLPRPTPKTVLVDDDQELPIILVESGE